MIGSKLRQFRLAKGWTLDDLAEASNLSRGTIHRIELDQVSPRLDTLQDLCRALGTSLAECFDEPAAGSPTGLRKGALAWLEHTEALIRLSSDSLTVLDGAGRVQFESEAALAFPTPPGEPRRARLWWSTAHPEDQAELEAAFRACLQGGDGAALGPYRAQHRDGTWHWLRTSFSRQLDHPLIQGVIAATQDITHLQTLQEGLERRRTSDRLGSAMGGLTHTLSNLLMGIQSHADQAQGQQADADALAAHLAAVQAGIQEAAELLDRLRDFAGQPILYRQPICLNTLVAGQIEERPGDTPVTLELAPGLPRFRADLSLLERLFHDLLNNALEAGGPVTVRTFQGLAADPGGTWVLGAADLPGAWIGLEIADRGCGMAPDLLARAFEPFLTTRPGHQGLGLAAALGTLRTHGGALWVASSVGEGTTLRAYLPQGEPVEAPAPAARAPLHGTQVLVVDDEALLRSCLRDMLDRIGHSDILEAEDGEQALNLFEAHRDKIGLVLLDVDMPGLGGLAVYKRIRELAPEVRVVFSTGTWEPHPAEADGRSRLLRKPYRLHDLRDMLEAFA